MKYLQQLNTIKNRSKIKVWNKMILFIFLLKVYFVSLPRLQGSHFYMRLKGNQVQILNCARSREFLKVL